MWEDFQRVNIMDRANFSLKMELYTKVLLLMENTADLESMKQRTVHVMKVNG